MQRWSTTSPKPLLILLPVTLNESFLTSTSSDLHPAFWASFWSSFSSRRSLSKVIASFNGILLAPVFLGDLCRLELDDALGYRLHFVVGAAFLALHYLADYGVVWDVDVRVALFALCLQLASHLSFQVRAHLALKAVRGFIEF